MKNYYTLLDSEKLGKEYYCIFNYLREADAIMTLNDEGQFDSNLTDESIKKFVTKYEKSFPSYRNLNLGDVVNFERLLYFNHFFNKDYYKLVKNDNLFDTFGFCKENCEFISLEFLIAYFMETFEDFKINVISGFIFSDREEDNYVLLVKVDIDENIANKINKENSKVSLKKAKCKYTV